MILSLDQGTTSSRAILFDAAGSPAAAAQQEFPQHYPRPGWVEHDPADIWKTQLAVAETCAAQSRARAIGITNQRETTLVWERATGRPIAPAIVWQDRRTAPICDELRLAGHAGLVAERTGLVVDPYFSGTKLRWILDNVAGARRRAEAGELAFGTVDTWLIWNLTAGRVHATDPSNASRTMLFNIHAGDWDADLLRLLRVPREVLPEIRPSSGDFGEVRIEGPLRGLPIAGVAGDQQAALFGQGCFKPGMAKNTYGTGCFVMLNTGTRPMASRNQLLTTVAWKLGATTTYALEGAIFMGGAIVQWLRDQLGLIQSAAEIEALAASVPDSGGVVLVPAFTGLGAPYWDPHARGALFGLTRGSSRAHIARAALEAIALQTRDILEAMQADAGVPLPELRADGGACVNNLLLQTQADLLGVPVLRPQVTETTALGAAYLAGLATGFWPSLDAIADQWQVERRFTPAGTPAAQDRLLALWRRALDRSGHWENEE